MGILAEDGSEEMPLFVQLPLPIQASQPSRAELPVYDRGGHEATPAERGSNVVQETIVEQNSIPSSSSPPISSSRPSPASAAAPDWRELPNPHS
ncbi:hypothetical protein V501_01388 [Pseudogymnoascus sp. VKM F-4519 (FW-2642)]|nr:hypothetical protein V501_01388 [Pseudogymnoascus sp. VKM F-4519 (FW-2642)]